MHGVIEAAGRWVEAAGVVVTLIGAAYALVRFAFSAFLQQPEAYREFRRNLGRAILIGLEFLIIGDIIGTVVLQPSLENLSVLAGIVLVRTFLSFALEVEIEGRWPWNRASS